MLFLACRCRCPLGVVYGVGLKSMSAVVPLVCVLCVPLVLPRRWGVYEITRFYVKATLDKRMELLSSAVGWQHGAYGGLQEGSHGHSAGATGGRGGLHNSKPGITRTLHLAGLDKRVPNGLTMWF
jgi:hypothetical protein